MNKPHFSPCSRAATDSTSWD